MYGRCDCLENIIKAHGALCGCFTNNLFASCKGFLISNHWCEMGGNHPKLKNIMYLQVNSHWSAGHFHQTRITSPTPSTVHVSSPKAPSEVLRSSTEPKLASQSCQPDAWTLLCIAPRQGQSEHRERRRRRADSQRHWERNQRWAGQIPLKERRWAKGSPSQAWKYFLG